MRLHVYTYTFTTACLADKAFLHCTFDILFLTAHNGRRRLYESVFVCTGGIIRPEFAEWTDFDEFSA